MKIAKIFAKGMHRPAEFWEVIKQSPVKFDHRPGWVFCRTVDTIARRADVQWFHPGDVHFEWIREFK